MPTCNHCTMELETDSELNTHLLLRHPDKIDDTDEYESEVGDEFLDAEVRADDGEQFGYR